MPIRALAKKQPSLFKRVLLGSRISSTSFSKLCAFLPNIDYNDTDIFRSTIGRHVDGVPFENWEGGIGDNIKFERFVDRALSESCLLLA